jgi:hypothetical protein
MRRYSANEPFFTSRNHFHSGRIAKLPLGIKFGKSVLHIATWPVRPQRDQLLVTRRGLPFSGKQDAVDSPYSTASRHRVKVVIGSFLIIETPSRSLWPER